MTKTSAWLAGLLGLSLFLALASVYRPVCPDFHGNVRDGSWGFDPTAWFVSKDLCQNETLAQWGLGQLSDSLEQAAGGPDRDELRRLGEH